MSQKTLPFKNATHQKRYPSKTLPSKNCHLKFRYLIDKYEIEFEKFATLLLHIKLCSENSLPYESFSIAKIGLVSKSKCPKLESENSLPYKSYSIVKIGFNSKSKCHFQRRVCFFVKEPLKYLHNLELCYLYLPLES